jgi:CheY-like chemotaxis protein
VSKSIALAEDDSDDQLLFTEALKHVCKTTTLAVVENGVMMLDLLEKRMNSLPDVIILDVNMPGMSGIECLKIIRVTKGLDHLPVIIMSTSANPKTIDDAFHSGANSYAVKPGRYDDLKSIVEKIIKTDWNSSVDYNSRATFMMKPASASR